MSVCKLPFPPTIHATITGSVPVNAVVFIQLLRLCILVSSACLWFWAYRKCPSCLQPTSQPLGCLCGYWLTCAPYSQQACCFQAVVPCPSAALLNCSGLLFGPAWPPGGHLLALRLLRSMQLFHILLVSTFSCGLSTGPTFCD